MQTILTTFLGLDLAPLLFQDDIARLATSVDSVQKGNDRLDCVANGKLLEFHNKKSSYLVFGNKRSKKEVEDDLRRHKLTLNGAVMDRAPHVKYLGDYLCEEGLGASVAMTVEKRKGLVMSAIYEIRSLIDDCRSHVVGGLVSHCLCCQFLFYLRCR